MMTTSPFVDSPHAPFVKLVGLAVLVATAVCLSARSRSTAAAPQKTKAPTVTTGKKTTTNLPL